MSLLLRTTIARAKVLRSASVHSAAGLSTPALTDATHSLGKAISSATALTSATTSAIRRGPALVAALRASEYAQPLSA